MFEKFTEKSIKVIMLAQEEARRLGHNFVGTEFMLLGLIGEGTGIAAKTLKSVGVNLKDARVEVETMIGRGNGFTAIEIPFTLDAKRQIELAWDEAKKLGHHYIGTEHLLLGLIRLDGTDGLKVLDSLKVEVNEIRAKIIRALGEAGANAVAETSLTSAVPSRAVQARRADWMEEAVHKILFEAVVSALPSDIKGLVLNLRQVVCDKEDALCAREFDEATELGEQETQLLKQLSEQIALSPQTRKAARELNKIRREKEEAIKAQEFDKAASLREKEGELSEKLRELKSQLDDRDGTKG